MWIYRTFKINSMNLLCCVLSPIAKVGTDAFCIHHVEELFKIRAEAAFKDPLRKAALDGEDASNALNPTFWGYYKTKYSARGKIKRRIIKREKYLTRPGIVAKVDQQIVDLRAEEETAGLKIKELNKQCRELRKPKRVWDKLLKARMLEGVDGDVGCYDWGYNIHVYQEYSSGQHFSFDFKGPAI